MRIDIITVLPSLLDSFLSHSIVQRAQDKGLVELNIHDLRDYSLNKHRTVDDYAYGGGAGMVLMIEPVVNCLETLQKDNPYQEVIYMSPDGEPLTQAVVNELSLVKNVIIICGHYKGIDERVREKFITREISIGDYVLSGGELPAAQLLHRRQGRRGQQLPCRGAAARVDLADFCRIRQLIPHPGGIHVLWTTTIASASGVSPRNTLPRRTVVADGSSSTAGVS